MSEGPDTAPPPEAVRRASRLPKAILAVALGLILLFSALVLGTRYGVLLPQARLLIEARTDGLKVGRFGQLRVEGLSGDVWRDFRIRRLTIRDEKGVWLEAENLHMRWRYAQLLLRRFQADQIEIETLRLIRRPTLTPKGKEGGMPVSFFIDQATARVEFLPAFSGRHGLYDVSLYLAVPRRGGVRGDVHAKSLLNPGDHLNVQFDIDKRRPLVLRADAAEAHGGALAGALGLPADQPFLLRVEAGGKISAGRFNALVLSGASRPLEASGAWTPDGGQASGRASLTASSLTAAWAGRLGPEVRFDLSGTKSGADFHALGLNAVAENLTVKAQGLANLGERRLGPQGISLTASTPALSRITGGPQMGPAQVQGVLTAKGKRQSFVGTATANRLEFAGYRLGQVSGPLELTRDPSGVAVKAQLAARGGAGSGLVAALLGGAPRALLDGARLADGRISLRRLEVTGAGLRAQASGGRSLLGGLSLEGDAQLSNLAAARAGASGAARISWSAAQSRAGQPWNLKLDAAGERFATGFAELDRLLGPKPRLAAQGALQGRRLSIARASLDGAAMNAAGAGVLGQDGKLSFKIDWGAQGPFRAGPVEVTGKAKGTGALTGTLGAPRVDLLADIAAVDLPRLPLQNAHLTLSFLRRPNGSSGMIAIVADSAYGKAQARSDFAFPRGGVDLSNLAVDAGGVKAAGSASLRRSTPSAADLTLAIGRGAFLESGKVAGSVRIVDAAGGPKAQLKLTAEAARMPGSTITIAVAQVSADGPLARLPYAVNATGAAGVNATKFALAGDGVLTQLQPGYAISFEGAGRLGEREARTVEAATFRFVGSERSAHLRLATGEDGRINLDGRLSKDDADVKAQLAGVSLSMLDEDLTGQVNATVSLQGRGDRLDGALDAKLTGARGRGAPAESGLDSVIRGQLADSTLTLDATAKDGMGLTANANLVLPTEASAAPFRLAIARQQPMRGKFFANGEIRPLWDLLVGGERSLSGMVQTQGTIGGTLADPQAVGGLTVSGGQFDDGSTGLSLRNLTVEAKFNHDAVDVTQASAVDGHGGTVSGAGRISLERQGASTFRLDLRRFRLIDNELATASATGQATINRAADGKVKLAGALTIDRADVAPRLPTGTTVVNMEVIEKNRPPSMIATEPVAARRPANAGWALDVRLRAPDQIFIRGRGLNVELSLDAHVGGTTASPALSGVAQVVRGDYDFAGKRFEFDNTSVVHLSTRPRDIRLDLSATREDPTLTAIVRIRGTAARPEITFSSVPSLPNDEVLSQVLFGASASQLSPLEAAQLAAALSSLASGGGMDILGNLRAFAGLDRLALGGGDEAAGGVTVSGGKYITDNVYLEITGGGRQGPTAQVEWRVRRQLSIVSLVGGTAGAKVSVRWRRDY